MFALLSVSFFHYDSRPAAPSEKQQLLASVSLHSIQLGLTQMSAGSLSETENPTFTGSQNAC